MRTFRGICLMVLKWGTMLAGVFIGGISCPAYGMMVPPKPHDPTLTLDELTYSPPSPVNQGDIVVFTVKTNKYTNAGSLNVVVGDPPKYFVHGNDYGQTPDENAQDGIWTGELKLPPAANLDQNMPTIARLDWHDGTEGLEISGEDLTIIDGDA